MVREINGLGGSPSTGKTSGREAGKPASDTAGSRPADDNRSQTDAVELSAEVRTLQSLTDQVKDLPDANLERAEQIRLALESGEYKIDDLVVADKLLQSDALFGK